MSLASKCREVIVCNIERYPAEAFGILDEIEWETLIQQRHTNTRPLRGKGGLDGTGRINPAVSDKFMRNFEETLPHLAHSRVVDTLVWKDIVEYRYRVGGLSRPKGLMYPGPILDQKANESTATILSLLSGEMTMASRKAGIKAIQLACELPMDVALLISSGIGKAAKKFLKACAVKRELEWFNTNRIDGRHTLAQQLQAALSRWMSIAQLDGVNMKIQGGKGTQDTSAIAASGSPRDLKEARSCNSWRELYASLREKDETRRNSHGAKMRERRQLLDSARPKIVKVRHSSSRQNAVINRDASRFASTPSTKVQQLRQEAKITSTRRAFVQPPKKKGFGDAVAFATKNHTKRKAAMSTVNLAGGKRMKVPKGITRDNVKKRLDILRRGGRR